MKVLAAMVALAASARAAEEPICEARCGTQIGFLSGAHPPLYITYQADGTLDVPQTCRAERCGELEDLTAELKLTIAALSKADLDSKSEIAALTKANLDNKNEIAALKARVEEAIDAAHGAGTAACGAGEFFSKVHTQCLRCHASCEKCTGTGIADCIQCPLAPPCTPAAVETAVPLPLKVSELSWSGGDTWRFYAASNGWSSPARPEKMLGLDGTTMHDKGPLFYDNRNQIGSFFQLSFDAPTRVSSMGIANTSPQNDAPTFELQYSDDGATFTSTGKRITPTKTNKNMMHRTPLDFAAGAHKFWRYAVVALPSSGQAHGTNYGAIRAWTYDVKECPPAKPMQLIGGRCVEVTGAPTPAPPPKPTSCRGLARGNYALALVGKSGKDYSGSYYCDGDGFMLIQKWGTKNGGKGTGPCNGSKTAGSNCKLDTPSLAGEDGRPCAFPDSFTNDIVWSKFRITANDDGSGADPQRIITTKKANKPFEVQTCLPHHASQPHTGNGRHHEWCYSHSPTQHSCAGCMQMKGTNTAGVSPHEAGMGGHWVHGDGECRGHDCGFSCGMGHGCETGCTIFSYTSQHWIEVVPQVIDPVGKQLYAGGWKTEADRTPISSCPGAPAQFVRRVGFKGSTNIGACRAKCLRDDNYVFAAWVPPENNQCWCYSSGDMTSGFYQPDNGAPKDWWHKTDPPFMTGVSDEGVKGTLTYKPSAAASGRQTCSAHTDSMTTRT